MDDSWDYNEGDSEQRMGKALHDGYREKVFLRTKIDGRTKKEAARQIEQSLKRLQVDCLEMAHHAGGAGHLTFGLALSLADIFCSVVTSWRTTLRTS